MRFDVADETFRRSASEWLAQLDDGTIFDLAKVFAISPGYYPTTLLSLWRAEVLRRGITPVVPQQLRRELRRLPVSHPHDADWRFTPETASDLVQRASRGLVAGAGIAHLGTPSTYAVGCKAYDSYQHVLFERNAAMTAAFGDAAPGTVVTADLGALQVPPVVVDAVIADPPWYLENTLVFLAAASRLCREGGLIWLCQPTTATRPGIEEERADLLAELEPIGLASVEVLAGILRYQMPHFEAMSLRTAEAELMVPRTWRSGDLLILRKVGFVQQVPPALPSEAWQELAFGPVRIKVRRSEATEDLAPLVPGDVLDTVSRRDPIRASIGFWTSGNRVFGLVNPEQVGNLVRLCNSDLEAMQFTLAHTLDHAKRLGMPASTASQLFDVLLVELQEHNAWEDDAL